MMKLSDHTDCVIYFEFYPLYQFHHEKYDTSWFFREEIIDKYEKMQFQNIRINEVSTSYSTDILHFFIDSQAFRISIRNRRNLAILYDTVKSVVSTLGKDIKTSITYKLNYHFTLESKRKVRSFVESFYDPDCLTDIDSEFKPSAARFTKHTVQKNFEIQQSFLVAPCDRDSGSKDLHLFTSNSITLKNVTIFSDFDNDFDRITIKSETIVQNLLDKHQQL